MGADMVIFRRMRGLFWGGLVVGTMLLVPTIVAVTCVLANAGVFGDATVRAIGGPDTVLDGSVSNVLGLAWLITVFLGATAGALDLQHGTMRELVLAGRRRSEVALRRLAAAAAWVLLALAVAFALSVAIALALAPNEGSIGWQEQLRNAAAGLPGLVTVLCVCFGTALFFGSRGPGVGLSVLFFLVIDGILSSLPKVGDVWIHVSISRAVEQTSEWIQGTTVFGNGVNSGPEALAVQVAWTLAVPIIGLVRLERRDL